MNYSSGDVFINTFFGDFWVAEDENLIRMNDGQVAIPGDKSGFVKVGHIQSIKNLETSFYDEHLEPCPICKFHNISCSQDRMNMKWKIGCNTEGCPCCIDHMVGSYRYRQDAVNHWNKR